MIPTIEELKRMAAGAGLLMAASCIGPSRGKGRNRYRAQAAVAIDSARVAAIRDAVIEGLAETLEDIQSREQWAQRAEGRDEEPTTYTLYDVSSLIQTSIMPAQEVVEPVTWPEKYDAATA